jgi:beta-lactamase class A
MEAGPALPGRWTLRSRDVLLPITMPQPHEANPGIVVGNAPRGTTSITIGVDGRRFRTIELRPGKRRFSIGPLGLPQGDHTISVTARHGDRVLAGRTIGDVTGLPRVAFQVTRARITDARAQRTLARIHHGGGASTAVWARDLRSGRAASWNAGATFPAASTLKLAILMTSLSRSSGDPTRSGLWPTYRAMILDSSNPAANAVLSSFGGSTSGGSALVESFVARLGATSTIEYGGYEGISSTGPPAGRNPSFAAFVRARTEIPPVRTQDQPSYAYGKHTTAHDLGVIASSLVAAAAGRGAAAAEGISAREARVALWLLIHARYPGLVRPATAATVGHKAGWLGDVEHDDAIVFSRHGTIVLAVMTYRSSGVALSTSQAYAAQALGVARSRLQR